MTQFDERFRLVEGGTARTLCDFTADPFELRANHGKGSEVMLATSSPQDVVAAIVALDGWAGAVHLASPPRDLASTDYLTARREAGRKTNVTEAGQAGPTRWVLYTSGTTGEPKRVEHTIATLTSASRKNDKVRDLVWGLLYEPTRMAGLQVLLQAMVAGSQVVTAAGTMQLAAKVRAFQESGVTAVSGTPTMWRKILLTGGASGWPLQQITLGGEIADQRLLDALARAFPSARITHVFASTETGAAFAVSDGRAGFPVSYLREAPRGTGLRIVDGVLQVFRPEIPIADSDGYVSTGDAVTIDDDRIYFLGRTSGVANVGGAKVWPEQVEELIRTHPDVLDAVVNPKKNPVTGEILTATVALKPGASIDSAGIRQWVREQAPLHHVPATVRLVDSLDESAAGKVVRR